MTRSSLRPPLRMLLILTLFAATNVPGISSAADVTWNNTNVGNNSWRSTSNVSGTNGLGGEITQSSTASRINSDAGRLTLSGKAISGPLTLAARSRTAMQITGSSASLYDQIVVVGTGAGGLSHRGKVDRVLSDSFADLTTFHLFNNFTSHIGDSTSVKSIGTDGYAGLTVISADGVWTSIWTANQKRLIFSTETGD